MGSCTPRHERLEEDFQVSKELESDKMKDLRVMKLLFLGSGGSGKSTFFKQLKTVHGEGFEEQDKIQYRENVYLQVIEQMKQLVEGLETLKETEESKFGKLEITEEGKKAFEIINGIEIDYTVDEDVASAIEILWKEKALKAAFEERAKLKVEDSSEYFFENVRRIAKKDYSPTQEDILRVRHRTTGVVEQELRIHDTLFHIFDVGGQRSERKKWIHCFEYVHAVIFVASLAAYNEVLFEDEECNAMHDSLNLFEEVSNSKWLEKTAMILFLNKQDEFARRIQRFPLKICFTDYTGENFYEPCVEFVKMKYSQKNKSASRPLYSHVTIATDQNNVERVFDDVQNIIVRMSLVNGGLVTSSLN